MSQDGWCRAPPKQATKPVPRLLNKQRTISDWAWPNLVNLFNPSVLVLDQRLNLAGQGLLDQVHQGRETAGLEFLDEEYEHSLRNAKYRGQRASIALEKHFEIP